jgi:hypothetical protein
MLSAALLLLLLAHYAELPADEVGRGAMLITSLLLLLLLLSSYTELPADEADRGAMLTAALLLLLRYPAELPADEAECGAAHRDAQVHRRVAPGVFKKNVSAGGTAAAHVSY